MALLNHFEAINYRGLHSLSLGPLRRVNLITGPNGVGKTSLAEAMWLYYGRYNPTLLWNLHLQRRRITEADPLVGLGGHPLELRGLEGDQELGVRFEFEEQLSLLPIGQSEEERTRDIPLEGIGNFATEFPSQMLTGIQQFSALGRLRAIYDPDPQPRTNSYDVILGPTGIALSPANLPPQKPLGIIVPQGASFPISIETIDRFSKVVAQGEKTHMLEILGVVQPTIKDIEVLSFNRIPTLWADIGGKRLLPVESLGGGVVRMLVLFVNFFAARDGLLVIDEIENGIHYSALPQLWQQILELSKLLNVQCVATTHSLESVRVAALSGENEQPPPDFALHQMYYKDNERRVETYTDDKLMAALDLGFEVR